ncbi:hypothetical protein CFC21_039331 [Triticum aestivum]|uniref:Neprosin PEP catalytic domain-containing protein n=3 Tax=Triticum TaxID=4564 RepID=A0A9R1JRX3_WHEAT|nr:uncharacterized protein LOC123064519 [Triticum aestivum]KAF7027277.1 hypothetical protein CFC21_039331 [Triticum aestivum]CDM80770.1 unnamed protein product [Triticum aestivum]VAH71616.1 unnamed protein product [Triticum turgidum subsp. durum]
MNLSWCSLLLLVVFAAELALAAVVDDAVQFDPKDIKMTIKSRNGEIIDCVDIYKQPSLNNPLLKDLKHQIMRDIASAVAGQQDGNTRATTVEQEWHKGTRQCPMGSIPILRTNPSVNYLTGSLFPSPLRAANISTWSGAANAAGPRYEFAVAIAANGPYSGAYVQLPVWKPARVHGSEYTATYLLLAGTKDTEFDPTPGVLPPDVTNQIAAGLFAYPEKDTNPRLNIFYTADGGKTLCYNLNCGGFVQTSRAIALGASIVNGASGVDDPVPYLLVSIEKSAAGPWHVLVNDTDLGYYPRAIFPWWMFPESVANLMGGTVLNTWPGGKHTDTVVGNGRRPPRDSKPAIVKGYVAVDLDGHPFPDTLEVIVHTAPNCYDVKFFDQSNGSVGASVAFGGSGGPDCAPRPA